MKKLQSFLFMLVSILPALVHSSTIGSDASTPGYSASDILVQSGFLAPDGIYWIDPDLSGGDDPFTVFADMTFDGGGWTMANDVDDLVPTLDGRTIAIDILAVNQTAQLRFIGDDYDAYFTGNYYDVLPSTGWTVLSGDPTALFGTLWSTSFSVNDVFVRETTTTAYPATIPVPAAVWLFGSGLIGLIGVARRKKT